MGLLGSIQRKIYSGHERKEDESRIYFQGNEKDIESILKEEYKEFSYDILTTGEFPVLSIYQKDIPMSCFSGKSIVMLKNRTGNDFRCERALTPTDFNTLFIHSYMCSGDYVYPDKEGHHYTLNELTADAKAAIDDIIRQENEHRNNLKNDPEVGNLYNEYKKNK